MIKRRIGGKYVRVTDADGYFGRNDAGNRRYKGGGGEPIKREFIGSKTKEYTFSTVNQGA